MVLGEGVVLDQNKIGGVVVEWWWIGGGLVVEWWWSGGGLVDSVLFCCVAYCQRFS
jgi:hypothetical protein